MKGLILAGGLSKRLGGVEKCSVPIGNKLLVENSLDRLSTINSINEIIIVISSRESKIPRLIGDSRKDKPIRYLVQNQNEHRGLIGSIETALPYLTEDFYLMLGDELMIESKHHQMTDEFVSKKCYGIIGYCLVEDSERIKDTYSIVAQDDMVLRLVEKPAYYEIPNNMMGTGNCIFDVRMLDYLENLTPHPKRGEREMVDWIQTAIENKCLILAYPICKKYANVNTFADLEEAYVLLGGI